MTILATQRTVTGLLSGLAVTIALLGSWAFVHAEGTTISVCVRHSGAVYVIGAGFRREDCRDSDQLLTWNVQGPAGPQGPAGATGPTGPQGPVGPAGSTGPAGVQGIAGVQGSQGEQGPQGPAGGSVSRGQIYAVERFVTLPSPSAQVVIVRCRDDNDVLLHGGYYKSTQIGLQAVYSVPNFDAGFPMGWEVQFTNANLNPPADVAVKIQCIAVP